MRFYLFLLAALPVSGQWPQFRGPNGSGVAAARNLPTDFGPDKNAVWKVDLPPGHSSPVIGGGSSSPPSRANRSFESHAMRPPIRAKASSGPFASTRPPENFSGAVLSRAPAASSIRSPTRPPRQVPSPTAAASTSSSATSACSPSIGTARSNGACLSAPSTT